MKAENLLSIVARARTRFDAQSGSLQCQNVHHSIKRPFFELPVVRIDRHHRNVILKSADAKSTVKQVASTFEASSGFPQITNRLSSTILAQPLSVQALQQRRQCLLCAAKRHGKRTTKQLLRCKLPFFGSPKNCMQSCRVVGQPLCRRVLEVLVLATTTWTMSTEI